MAKNVENNRVQLSGRTSFSEKGAGAGGNLQPTVPIKAPSTFQQISRDIELANIVARHQIESPYLAVIHNHMLLSVYT